MQTIEQNRFISSFILNTLILIHRLFMKRVLPVIVIIIFVFLIVSFFIPASLENRVFIANTYQNIVSSFNQPRNWIKWDSEVRNAWQKDSSACRFQQDS